MGVARKRRPLARDGRRRWRTGLHEEAELPERGEVEQEIEA
jgi:hypothetical protein